MDQLCVAGTMTDLADVLTSSGHSGRFSFGLSTRQQHADTGRLKAAPTFYSREDFVSRR